MNDFTAELTKLQELTGGDYSRQVERIALRKEFHPLDTDKFIFSVGGEKVMTTIINEKVIEVLIFKGRKHISVNRAMVFNGAFLFNFKRFYER